MMILTYGWESKEYVWSMLTDEISWGEYESVDELTEYYKDDFTFTFEEILKLEEMIFDYLDAEEAKKEDDYDPVKALYDGWAEDMAVERMYGVA